MKFKLKEEMYLSDQARLDYLKQAKKSKNNCDYEDVTEEELLDTPDLIIAGKCKSFVWFFEFWTDSCWDGLYMKTEYEGLSQTQAMEKFMQERFPILAQAINGEIWDWNYQEADIYDGGVLRVYIKIQRSDKK